MKNKLNSYLSAIVLFVMLGLVLFKFGIFDKKDGLYFGDVIKEFCVNDKCYKNDDQSLNLELIKVTTESWSKIFLVDLISTNKDKFFEMGFGDPKVLLKINNKVLEIGAISSDYTGTFVKRENENKIYKINVIMDKNNISNSEHWVKKENPVLDSKK